MLFKYAGLLSVVTTGLFIVAPLLTAGNKSKDRTISEITNNKNNLYIVNFGLIIGALLQLLFLGYLIDKFQLSTNYLFKIVYFGTIMSPVLTALNPYYKRKTIHNFFVKYYFISSPIYLMMFGLTISSYQLLSQLSIIMSLIYILGNIAIFAKYKKENALIEVLSFSLLSIWTIAATFT